MEIYQKDKIIRIKLIAEWWLPAVLCNFRESRQLLQAGFCIY